MLGRITAHLLVFARRGAIMARRAGATMANTREFQCDPRTLCARTDSDGVIETRPIVKLVSTRSANVSSHRSSARRNRC